MQAARMDEVEHALASDINGNEVRNTEQMAHLYEVNGNISFRQSDVYDLPHLERVDWGFEPSIVRDRASSGEGINQLSATQLLNSSWRRRLKKLRSRETTPPL